MQWIIHGKRIIALYCFYLVYLYVIFNSVKCVMILMFVECISAFSVILLFE